MLIECRIDNSCLHERGVWVENIMGIPKQID
jgi:hypothetical protein